MHIYSIFFFRYHVYICIYVVLQRASRRLVRQLSHPLKIKSLLTYLLTTLTFGTNVHREKELTDD